MCQKNLDGWEEDDDPAHEHLHHSTDCGWAIISCAVRAEDVPDREEENPFGERMVEARRATFADRWPHQGKRGWQCKVDKVCFLTSFSRCSFLLLRRLSLIIHRWSKEAGTTAQLRGRMTLSHVLIVVLALTDGSLKINPCKTITCFRSCRTLTDVNREEHRRRSPTCPFIELCSRSKRTLKKIRPSKGSRLSNLSVVSTRSELHIVDDIVEESDSRLTAATDSSTAPKTGKKSAKGRKTTEKSKAKKASAKKAEVIETNNLAEPEDSGFEVLVDPPVRAARGRKRKTDEIEAEVVAQPEPGDQVIDGPAPKRRMTQKRSSVGQHADGLEDSASSILSKVNNSTITDLGTTKRPKVMGSNKGRKTRSSCPRVSKRKPSAAAPAATALHMGAAVNDEEIDQALEAELDRPLADEENHDLDVEVTDAEDQSDETTQSASTAADDPVDSDQPFLRSGSSRSLNTDEEVSAPLVAVETEPLRSDSETESPPPPPKTAASMVVSKAKLVKPSGGRKPSAKQEMVLPKPTEARPEPIPHLVETTTPSPSPQSSDAENHPPSSRPTRPSSTRLAGCSQSTHHHSGDVPLATRTPLRILSASKKANVGVLHGYLQSDKPWSAVNLETVFGQLEDEQENMTVGQMVLSVAESHLTSPEKALPVKDWLYRNAALGEERLRRECDRMVCLFERKGNEALQALEGITVVD